MGLGLGFNKNKSKSTSDTTSSYDKTSTPTNPDWVSALVQGLSGQVGGLAGQDPQSFVAGPSGLQQQQFNLAGQLGPSGAAMIGQANGNAQAATQAAPVTEAQAQTAYQGIGNYLNPFTSYVAGNTLDQLGRARTMAEVGNGRDANLVGGYGGSRQGVVDANLNRDFFSTAGSTLGNLFSGGFNTALGAADADANRAQQTSIFNAAAGNTSALAQQQALLQAAGLQGQLGQFGLGYLADTGATQQGLNQQQAGAPLDVAQLLAQISGTLPLGLFQGSTESGTSVSNTKTKGKQTGLSAAATYGS